MTRDPFDVLERQLHDAVQHAARRPWTTRLRRGGLAIVIASAIGATAAAAAGVFGTDSHSAVDQAIQTGYSATQNTAACQILRPGQLTPPKVIPGAADSAIRARYAIFRRPTRPSDRTAATRSPLFTTILADSRRVAHASDGSRVDLEIAQGPPRLAHQRDAVACVKDARDAAIASIPAKNVALRGHVLQIMNRRVAAVRRNSSPSARSLVTLFRSPFDRSAGGQAARITNGEIGVVMGYSTDRHAGRTFNRLYGLVPDGVATLRLIDASGPPSARAKPVTLHAHDNVFDVAIPPNMGPHELLQFRAADGHIIRTLHPQA